MIIMDIFNKITKRYLYSVSGVYVVPENCIATNIPAELNGIDKMQLLYDQPSGSVKDGRSIEQQFLDKQNTKIAEITELFNKLSASGFITSSGINMNANISDVQRLKSAYDLAVLMNQPSLPVVIDFNNLAHADMPLTDVLSLIIELGVNYQTLYARKQALRSLAMAATTEAQLDAIAW